MAKGVLKYVVIFLSLCSTVFAINSPEIRCVLVVPNGDVIISWAIPADPANEFKSYEIYYSINKVGPYVPIASQTSYTAFSYSTTGFNANTQPYYFYVQTKNTSNMSSPAIDTVETIFLTISPPGSSVAVLSWNDFHTPLPAGESPSYKIFKEYPINNWTQMGTMPVHNTTARYSFSDTISVCNDLINYRIELFDPVLSCTSVSNIKGNWFIDKNPPSAPQLDSVSVDTLGNVTIGIHPSNSPDTKCFVVYQHTGGTYIPIDTPCTGNTATIYTYTNSTANSSSEEFSVAAIDSCGNLGVIALNGQSTIYVQATFDICSKTASLTWNPYKNMTGGVNHYEILYSAVSKSGPFIHLADTTATIYFHKNLTQGVNYWYRIRAHSTLKNLAGRDSITSSSNIFPLPTPPANQPSYVYLSDVTVNNPAENIDVKWYVDKNVRVGGFNIYRSDNYNGPFSNAGFANYTAQNNYSFTDNSADASKQKYYYYIRVLDTCMSPIIKTDTSNSIFLQAVASGNFKATLMWNDYAKWLGNVTGYNIYRSLDGVFLGGPIATVPIGTNTYVDDLSNYTNYSGKFIYYVEAIEGSGNIYGLTELSESNYAYVYLDALMFVPNAFVPKGHNKVFLPIGDYIEKTDFKLSIIDRWGTKIYETTDENQGWDGGNSVEGLYAYLIEYKTAVGEYREQRGTVTLIR